MGVTNNARSVVAANLIGSALPNRMAVGTGSSTFNANQSGLLTEFTRTSLSNGDTSTANQVTLIYDFTPSQISGLVLKEFGAFTTGSVMLNREIVNGSVVFDGEQSLQIQQTFKFFI